jgi:predicted HTH domain antitoxin
MGLLVEVIAMCSNPSPALARVLRPGNTPSDQEVFEPVWMEVPPHPGRRTKIHLGPDQVTAVAAGYQAGRTIKELGAEFGIHSTVVSRILKEQGITLRLKPMSEKDVELAIELYQAGLSLMRVSEQVTKSPGTIRSELLRHGVSIRDSHGRARS